MRQQIAAANWKMNLTLQKGEALLTDILSRCGDIGGDRVVVFAVPFPYLQAAQAKVSGKANIFVAAQNCSDKKAGAFTGEVSAEMLQSLGIEYVVVGHSERREYYHETNQLLAAKLNTLLEYGMKPIFCCGEPLQVREGGQQNEFVAKQLEESLYHLSETDIQKIIIAYEPIWAIGTGKTASSEQAQEMHAFIRSALVSKYGEQVAKNISILYGGSVKGNNASELFANSDVDGGLVGGASLVADEFIQIIKALK